MRFDINPDVHGAFRRSGLHFLPQLFFTGAVVCAEKRPFTDSSNASGGAGAGAGIPAPHAVVPTD